MQSPPSRRAARASVTPRHIRRKEIDPGRHPSRKRSQSQKCVRRQSVKPPTHAFCFAVSGATREACKPMKPAKHNEGGEHVKPEASPDSAQAFRSHEQAVPKPQRGKAGGPDDGREAAPGRKHGEGTRHSQTTPSPSPSRMYRYAGCERETGAIPCPRASLQVILPFRLSS